MHLLMIHGYAHCIILLYYELLSDYYYINTNKEAVSFSIKKTFSLLELLVFQSALKQSFSKGKEGER